MNLNENDQSVAVAVQAPSSGFVRVCSALPFWRYAVGPASGHSPAIPYYRLAPAIDFFEEAKRFLPWAGVTLYRRRGWGRIETVIEYNPNTNPTDA